MSDSSSVSSTDTSRGRRGKMAEDSDKCSSEGELKESPKGNLKEGESMEIDSKNSGDRVLVSTEPISIDKACEVC